MDFAFGYAVGLMAAALVVAGLRWWRHVRIRARLRRLVLHTLGRWPNDPGEPGGRGPQVRLRLGWQRGGRR